jgi:SprT protein
MKPTNGTAVFHETRKVWLGYWDGRQRVAKNTKAEAEAWLQKKFGTPSVNTNAVHAQLKEQVAKEWDAAKSMFPKIRDLATPTVSFFSKGSTAGRAWYHRHLVEFNDVLAAENGEKFINTVKHEIAHLITNVTYPLASAHGVQFKSVMRMLGGDGERCHTYDVSSVKNVRLKKRVEYACACRSHNMTTQAHKKVITGKVRYTCKKCGQTLQSTGKVIIVK